MKNMKYLSLLSGMLLLSMAGCGMSENYERQPETETPAATEAQTEKATERETVPETEPVTESPGGINPLTGESGYPEEAKGKRPVAVMVNNLKLAYPQYGTSEADILYELPVEGGVTRMMAVYADQDHVPDVGSVRSCRYYFPKIAMGMDAIYCHWGAEQVHAVATMNSLNIDRFDGGKLENSILFYRDPERVGIYSSEHTGYLKGSEIPAAIEQRGIRAYAARPGAAFAFADEPRVPAESACTSAVIAFSESSTTGFDYDAAAQTYLMRHGSEPQMDGHTDVQLSYTNVFILQTQTSYLDEANYLRKIELEGGNGYYISMGGMESIRWIKEDDRSPIVYYAMDGSELEVNVGKSYVGIVGETRPLYFTT